MSKPKPIKIPSDDCEVVIFGKSYHPHEGEWVEVIPGVEVRDQRMAARVAKLRQEAKAFEGDEDEQEQTVILAGQLNDEICATLAEKLIAWSWTDKRGVPIELDGTPEPFYRLSGHELIYLLQLTGEEIEAERKNGSRPSRTTSSATAPRRSRSGSSAGRSRTRA